MKKLSVTLQALAEAVSGPARELGEGLLLRPFPNPEEKPGDLAALCGELHELLLDTVPALQESMAALEDCERDDLEELVDELVTPAFALVDMARTIWGMPLEAEQEGVRPLLATIAEAPVAELLLWMMTLMHATVDPWAVLDEPEEPDLEFALDVQDSPVREALRLWRQNHPGILPEDFHL